MTAATAMASTGANVRMHWAQIKMHQKCEYTLDFSNLGKQCKTPHYLY